MVQIPSLLLGLSVAGIATAARPYGRDKPAKISLYDASTILEADNLLKNACGPERGPIDVSLNINTCLWGKFDVDHFKVKMMPTCASGAQPVAFFYPGTSCTGNPDFRSDKQSFEQDLHGLRDECLPFTSPFIWSMIFRCDNLESEAIANGHYEEAIPYNSAKALYPTRLLASDGVVTPHSSFDCTIWKPKEPTHLPADTCLRLPGQYEGRSVFIHQPAICANGSAALVEAFLTNECQSSDDSPGLGTTPEGSEIFESDETDGHPFADGLSLDKKCFQSHTNYLPARSMRFRCDDKKMVMYEDLPPYTHAEVEPITLKPVSKPAPKEEDVSFHDDLDSEKIVKPTFSSGIGPQSTKPHGAKIESYYLEECQAEESRSHSVSVKPADTCVWSFMYKSMEVTSPAVCANGTQALFATYSRPGCKPADLKYLGDIPEEFTDGCADISNIDSFAFICEGLPETEIGNKGSVGGFLKFVGIVLLVLILMIALSVASCCLRGAAMMKQANELWARIMDAFKGREGAIQL